MARWQKRAKSRAKQERRAEQQRQRNAAIRQQLERLALKQSDPDEYERQVEQRMERSLGEIVAEHPEFAACVLMARSAIEVCSRYVRPDEPNIVPLIWVPSVVIHEFGAEMQLDPPAYHDDDIEIDWGYPDDVDEEVAVAHDERLKQRAQELVAEHRDEIEQLAASSAITDEEVKDWIPLIILSPEAVLRHLGAKGWR